MYKNITIKSVRRSDPRGQDLTGVQKRILLDVRRETVLHQARLGPCLLLVVAEKATISFGPLVRLVWAEDGASATAAATITPPGIGGSRGGCPRDRPRLLATSALEHN